MRSKLDQKKAIRNLEGFQILPVLRVIYRISTIFISATIFALAACSPSTTPVVPPTATSQSTNIITPTGTATETIEPTATVTTAPTEVPTPNPTPTPDYFAQAYELSSNEYVIPFVVRHTTEESATFTFELKIPAEGKLIYRNMESLIQKEVPLLTDKTSQTITVDNLTPGTTYEALVLLGNAQTSFQQPPFAGEAWGTIQFHTLPDQFPIRVGVLGDAGFGDEATQALVKQIAAQDLDFVIYTGDVVYEADPADIFNSYLQKYFQPFAPILHQGPIYTILGNHDYDSSVRWEGAPFYDYAFPPFPDPNFDYPETRRGNQYYAFSYQDIQFLMLDTHVFAGTEGRDEQDAWLEERLADPRFRITIPVFHVAPFSSSVVHPDDGLPVRYSWNWRFEEANVPLALSGHFHDYERLISNGITYIVSGGGSSTLYAQGQLLPESQRFARRTHFVLLEIDADHIEITAIAVDGETLDQAYIDLK
jgi:predicted phosphodiesterase